MDGAEMNMSQHASALVSENLPGQLLDESSGGVYHAPLPSVAEVENLVERIRNLLVARGADGGSLRETELRASTQSTLHGVAFSLRHQICAARRYMHGDLSGAIACLECDVCADEVTREFLDELPALRRALQRDAQAAMAGDPAANDIAEVVLCYPGHHAIVIHRIAHALWRRDVPLLPRIMTEYAHRITGIDIHPGATIGDSFFIDHGTGIVIGETAVVGDRVRIYQGVTLGALSLPAKRVAELRGGAKRHPTLQDDVVVYAGATILGGDTIIGRGSVIGGNCWVVESVPADSRVSVQMQVAIRRAQAPAPQESAAAPWDWVI